MYFNVIKNIRKNQTTTTYAVNETFNTKKEAEEYIDKKISEIFSNAVKSDYRIFNEEKTLIEYEAYGMRYKVWFEIHQKF